MEDGEQQSIRNMLNNLLVSTAVAFFEAIVTRMDSYHPEKLV